MIARLIRKFLNVEERPAAPHAVSAVSDSGRDAEPSTSPASSEEPIPDWLPAGPSFIFKFDRDVSPKHREAIRSAWIGAIKTRRPLMVFPGVTIYQFVDGKYVCAIPSDPK